MAFQRVALLAFASVGPLPERSMWNRWLLALRGSLCMTFLRALSCSKGLEWQPGCGSLL